MSWADVALLLTGAASIISALAAVAAAVHARGNGRRIEVIYHATNGLKDELVAATRLAALLQGRRDLLNEQQEAEDGNGN